MSEWLEVMMSVGDLRTVPHRAVPAGFAVRCYQPGDEKAWLEIHEAVSLARLLNNYQSVSCT